MSLQAKRHLLWEPKRTVWVYSGFYGNHSAAETVPSPDDVTNRYQPIRAAGHSLICLLSDTRVELTALGYHKLVRRARLTE